MKFNKPFLSIEQQVKLLSQRGLIVEHDTAHYLKHLNYYRLSGYWIPFQHDNKTHHFKPNVRFSDVLNLYLFDRELRLLLLDAIERIEISIRTQWAYFFAEVGGAHAHLVEGLNKNVQWHSQNIVQLQKEVARSDELFIKHYQNTYTSPDAPPIWAACEVMSFGLLSKWLKSMNASEPCNRIARCYQLDYSVLVSFVEYLAYLRNLCAHHSRVWNRGMTKTMKVPRSKPSDLINNFHNDPLASRRLYNPLVMIIHLLKIICPGNHFRNRLIALIKEHEIIVSAMGFPENWSNRSIWIED
ncbi:Abi family protein [Legionella micdadei]|uniref:Abi family protein n=1 Tax=Legionella micdadei TaxID=451 RepID=A0A098GIP7_LEGMI|nr:Abi family protein [Legionella micdadei]ARG96765.1 hypothetical protein B6N58_03280 [Legionella micdadei]KTD26434.1 AbiD phage protein-like protein [Legionella micdadei]NSL17974.1 Abi family protein [Legionella micdadei]CEG61850.1 Abi family protein [Legionella micdadei]SCY25440.1 Abortive infection bacteriophage resistance protein [Legionella micdadei]